jgi:hypothetical protein
MDISIVIDETTKLIGSACGVLTLFLAWSRILPRLDQIHEQTNSLAVKAEAGAHALGVQQGIKLATEIDPAVAVAAKAVLDAAVEKAAAAIKEGQT